MSDRFVTIASYASTPEAEMAKNLLETEGIAAFLAGEMTASTLTAFAGAAAEVRLQVREEDAARAVSLLATASAGATLDEDWEAQAERGLCVCSLCGMVIPVAESVCPACGTPSNRITTDRRDTWTKPPRRSDSQGVTKIDQVQSGAPRPGLGSTGQEAGASASPAGKGCAVLLLALPLLAVWFFLCR
jgi:hypothetical protein